MGIAALFDIHGNLPALEAVLADLEGLDVEQVVIGGDVLPGPMPRQTLERLLAIQQPLHWIRGNGDREVVEFQKGEASPNVPLAFHSLMKWCGEQLTEEQLVVLQSMSFSTVLECAGIGEVYFCHATPETDCDIFTRNTDAEILRKRFDRVAEKTIVCGHTHMQFEREVGGKTIVNAGSVGMAFGAVEAQWLWIQDRLEFKSTPYDLEAGAMQMKAAGSPGACEWVEQYVLNRPSEKMMLEIFDRAAIQLDD